MTISKRDLFNMTPGQQAAGRKAWDHTAKNGHLAMSSTDYEMTSVKTWIRYVNSKGEEHCVIECEVYHQPNSDGVAVGMLSGMCPKCAECFLVNEGNKTLQMDVTSYRRAPAWLKTHWSFHKRELNQIVTEDDKILLVSSPERWLCDYCKKWCVKVTENIASDNYQGAAIMYSSPGVEIGRGAAPAVAPVPVVRSDDFDI
jgi:hypothetical protein